MTIGSVPFGNGAFGLIAGPCMLESPAVVDEAAAALCAICARHQIQIVFKGSFDKANRTSARSERGPGLDAGLKMLADVRERYGFAVITDIHETTQAAPAAEVCDALQIPAFLCRQTDLIAAAAATGKPLLIKRGQFMAPDDMRFAVEKAQGAAGVLLAERGTCFGYRDLVVDFRALPIMRRFAPVIFDATHSVQQPGAAGGASGGAREFIAPLARAAVAVGCDGLFAEVHPDPPSARSDASTQLDPGTYETLLTELLRLRRCL